MEELRLGGQGVGSLVPGGCPVVAQWLPVVARWLPIGVGTVHHDVAPNRIIVIALSVVVDYCITAKP